MEYVATFYSHFGAVRFNRLCQSQGLKARMSPVPRDLSSSCGTCVWYQGAVPRQVPEEVEQIVEIVGQGYRVLYRAEGS